VYWGVLVCVEVVWCALVSVGLSVAQVKINQNM